MDLDALVVHAKEVRLAAAAFPGLDLLDAYTRWKKARGEPVVLLSSADGQPPQKDIDRFTKRPCPAPRCPGTMHLEAICNSCVEGKAGYNSKWTCDYCFRRRLSQLDFSDWFKVSDDQSLLSPD